jgi:hypothetical protein
MKKCSIVGGNHDTNDRGVGYDNSGDRMKVLGKTGVSLGELLELLFGSAFFWIPGLGLLLVAGLLARWMIGAMEGAVVVGGLNAIGSCVFSLGTSKDSSLRYATAFKTRQFALIAHGSVDSSTLTWGKHPIAPA